MANGTKYNTKEELLAAVERVKYNQNFETSSEKIQNNDKDIIESLWHDGSCEINELHTTGVVFSLQPTTGVSSMSFHYSADMRNMLTVGDLLMQNSRDVTETYPLIFPKGTVITDITGTPGDYTIMLSNPATYTTTSPLEFVFGDVVNYLEPTPFGPGTPANHMNKIFRIPDNINLLIIDIDNTYGGGYLRDVIALPYKTNTPLNGTKLRAIFKNVNLWEPVSPFYTLDGRLSNTWYDHFGASQGLIYDTYEAYFDFMWYNGIWFCDGIR